MKLLYILKMLLFIVFMTGLGAMAQQQPAANLDQTRNGIYTAPLTQVAWENGNVNASQAHMVEDYSNPYRIVMTNMPTNGTIVTLDIEYDTRHSAKNAFDFITGYNNLMPHNIWGTHSTPEAILPLYGISALTGATEVHILITKPGLKNGATSLQAYWDDFNIRKPGLDYMSLWGGNITGVVQPFQYLSEDSLNQDITSTQVRITFKSTSSTVVLSWGAHIAREQDWGSGNSAGGISGSPYHTCLLTWSLGNLGNQDRSLQAAAVIPAFDCIFTVPSVVCLNTSDTAKKVLPLSSLATYTWSIIDIVGADPAPLTGTGASFVFNSGTSPGSFKVKLVASVPFLNTTITQTCTLPVTVSPAPVCSITADQEPPYCPGSTNTFSGPDGMSSYAWTISGNGTITGSTDQQTVSVLSGSNCDSSYKLTLMVSDTNNCSSTCDSSFLVKDVTPPEITGCPVEGIDLGCNPVAPTCTDALALISATDDCGGTITPTCKAGDVTSDSCKRSQIFTLTAKDGCNDSTSCAVTYNWTVDTVPPQFSGCPASAIDLGCNPVAPTCTDALALVSVTDGCSGTITPTCQAGEVTSDGCMRSQIFTLTAKDACNDSASCAVTYNWTVDTVPPQFSGCPASAIDLGCNPVAPTCTDALALVSATDGCSGTITPTCQAGEVISDGCMRSQIFTLTAKDACNDSASCTVTYNWTVDTVPPQFSGCPTSTIDLGCNPTLPVCGTPPSVTDVCSGTIVPECSPGDIIQNGNTFSQSFTWIATDSCNNSDSCVYNYTWHTCAEIFCTYTQGFWGQSNGVACNGKTAPQNLADLLTTPIILGKASNNRTYTIGAGQVQCVTDVLPASGTPAAFGANYSCTTILKNTLFGQTLALALNLRYDNVVDSSDLGSVQLPPNGVITVTPSPDCNPTGIVTTRTIPANVMTYLSNYYAQTVKGIYDMANDALGNYWKSSTHPSFSNVNVAVSAINEAFDKCGNMTVLPTLPIKIAEDKSSAVFEVKIMPNPFGISTNISVTSDMDIDHVTIEIYSMVGQKIFELYNGSLSSGLEKIVTFSPRQSDNPGIYQLLVKSQSGVAAKKIIYVK